MQPQNTADAQYCSCCGQPLSARPITQTIGTQQTNSHIARGVFGGMLAYNIVAALWRTIGLGGLLVILFVLALMLKTALSF